MGDQEKPHKAAVGIVHALAKIWTGHLLNRSLEQWHNVSLLNDIVSMILNFYQVTSLLLLVT